MIKLPSISSYGKYSSNNYGMNALYVDFGAFRLYYSYSTLVAFSIGGSTYVRENNWGPTTGRHLNSIDGGNKKDRLPGEEFEQLYQEKFKGIISE